MFGVIKQNGALRLGFALRAGLGFLVIALLGCAAFFIRYEIMHVAQPARVAFWTGGGAVFVALFGASNGVWFGRRSPRFAVFIAAASGFLIGLCWAIATYYPMGLFPGVIGVPVGMIWPFSAALSFAYAAALVPRVHTPQPVGLGPLLALLAIAWIGFVKGGINRFGEPVDFARMVAPRRIHTPLGIAALDRGACVDPALVRARVLLDSTTVLSPLGQFTDVDDDAAPTEAIGHSVRLWRAGPEIVGVVSTWLGRGPGRHGVIENVRLEKNGTLTFDAFYGDGFYDHFEGRLTKRRFRGALTTADALCVRRVVAQNELKLRASAMPRRLPFASAEPRTLAQFQTTFGTISPRP